MRLILYLFCIWNCIVIEIVSADFIHSSEKIDARCGTTIVNLNSRYFIIAGGDNGESVVSSYNIYDNQTDKWTIVPMKTGRTGLVSASTMGVAYFAGGESGQPGSGLYPKSVEMIFDNETQWIPRSNYSLQAGRLQMSAISVNNLVIFAGGASSVGYYSGVDILSPVRQAVSMNLKVARSNMAVAARNNLAFFAGGRSKDGYSNVVEVLNTTDPDAMTWLLLPNLTVARADFTATTTSQYGTNLNILTHFSSVLCRRQNG